MRILSLNCGAALTQSPTDPNDCPDRQPWSLLQCWQPKRTKDAVTLDAYLKNEPCNSIWVLSLRFTSSGGFVTRWLAQSYLVTDAEAVNQFKHLTTA